MIGDLHADDLPQVKRHFGGAIWGRASFLFPSGRLYFSSCAQARRQIRRVDRDLPAATLRTAMGLGLDLGLLFDAGGLRIGPQLQLERFHVSEACVRITPDSPCEGYSREKIREQFRPENVFSINLMLLI